MLELVARHLRALEHPKMEVIEASDGSEAWRLAQERLPDLVVLDVMMPGMSGWEVCRKIRQDAALAHTGVLMLTGIGVSLNETTSPLFGADDYIDKPFDFESLDEKVVAILRHRAVQREAVPRPLASARARPFGRYGWRNQYDQRDSKWSRWACEGRWGEDQERSEGPTRVQRASH